ncbi:ComEC/Rec2 family competence protein [Saccharopolyspora taberi]|uniref:ComEC/Rec2 family competence protein n=1 Tax=Saccharopolyspora taberi TaxID=60895 RepID=A0ABN3V301_9PSEU
MNSTAADSPQRRLLDLRLVPAALSVWATTLVGLYAGWLPTAIVAAAVVLLTPVVALAGRSSRWVRGVLAVLILTGVAAAGVSLRMHQIERHPLRSASEHGERATVQAVIEDSPTPVQGASYGDRRAQDRAFVRAKLRVAEVSKHRMRTGGSVVLLVPAQGWQELDAGQEVTARGKLAPPRPGETTVAVFRVFGPPEAVAAAPEWQRLAEDLRDGLRRASNDVLDPAAAGLLPGLVVGDTDALPPEVMQNFNDAGLSHLVAVSGANLAIVCGAVLLLLHALGLGPVLSAIGGGLAMVGFVVLAGPEPSVLRAAVMGTIALLALILGRERSALPALAASVIVLLLVAPELASTVGFALSVAATAGLVLLAPLWSAALHARGVPVGIAEAVAVPAAAHLTTAPLVAAISGEVSAVAVVANLLAGPVIAPATVLGVVATICAPLSSWLADAAVWLAGPELRWTIAVAEHAAAVPGAVFAWPSGSAGGLLLAGVALAVLVLLRHKRIRWTAAALVLVVGVVLVPVRVLDPAWPARGWSMIACDVGQGDGLVLATGRPSEAVVVDTGPDPTLSAECLRRLGIRRVPLLVLTHLHADHVSGLRAVLVHSAVGAVAMGGLREPAWAMTDILRDTRSLGVPVIELAAGQQARWPALVLDVLGPRGELARTRSADDANDASIVLRATTPAGRILLTGDIELSGQSQLLGSGTDLRADVLKIPHHGSRYTTPRFLAAVRPRLALISVGAGNSYGHPSPLILSALAQTGAAVARTDEKGDIAVLPGPNGPRLVTRGDPLRPKR